MFTGESSGILRLYVLFFKDSLKFLPFFGLLYPCCFPVSPGLKDSIEYLLWRGASDSSVWMLLPAGLIDPGMAILLSLHTDPSLLFLAESSFWNLVLFFPFLFTIQLCLSQFSNNFLRKAEGKVHFLCD